MNADEYVSTGEAAKFLNISRSTVSRKFDTGELPGRYNPITRERSLSLQGLRAFMESHGIPTNGILLMRKLVVVATRNQQLSEALSAIAACDRRLAIETVNFGADAIVACLRRTPALLIVTGDLEDLSVPALLESLKRHELAAKLRVLCCLSGSEGETQALQAGASEVVLMRGDFRQDLQRRIYRVLGMPQEAPTNQVTNHRRRWPRIELSAPCRVMVYANSRPHHLISGSAVLRNVSRDGAFIERIHLEAPIPAEPFGMDLMIDASRLPDWSASCKVVRLESNGQLKAGLRFAVISRTNSEKISAIETESRSPIAQGP